MVDNCADPWVPGAPRSLHPLSGRIRPRCVLWDPEPSWLCKVGAGCESTQLISKILGSHTTTPDMGKGLGRPLAIKMVTN